MMMVSVPAGGAKGFMAKLLKEPVFDAFHFRKAAIESFARFEAEAAGKAGEGEGAPPCLWGRMRPYIHHMIMGGGTPGAMRVVLGFPPEEAERLFGAAALSFNVLFDSRGVSCTMGGAAKDFVAQKPLDEAWGSYMKQFLRDNQIDFTEE